MADRYSARTALYRLLEFVQRYLYTSVPKKSLRRLKPGDGDGQKLLEPVEIFTAMELGAKELSALTWLRLLRSGNSRESLSAAWRLLFPAPATMRRLYGVRSAPAVALCYIARPFQLAGRLARVLARILWSRRGATASA